MIPACVVKAIPLEFPEESGKYAGFKAAEIDFVEVLIPTMVDEIIFRVISTKCFF